MVTKRGTNNYHGSAYGYYYATNVGAANSWSNWSNNDTPTIVDGKSYAYTPLPSIHRNRFGGSLGGVMTPKFLGGKTYFFVNNEGSRFPNVSNSTKTVPSALLRAGVIQVADSTGNYQAYNLNPIPVTVNGVTYNPAPCGSGLATREVSVSIRLSNSSGISTCRCPTSSSTRATGITPRGTALPSVRL
jgi:hypothetical protein